MPTIPSLQHGPAVRPAALVLGLGLCILTVPLASSAEAAITKPFSPASVLALAPGIDYSKGTMRTAGGRRQSVRVATVDPSHSAVRLRSLLSNDKVIRKERPSRLAERKSSPGMRAMVATNGDRSVFGRTDAYAAPNSMHVSNGELMVVQACTRPTLGIDADGDARIGEVRVQVAATPPGRNLPKQIHRVNTHRDDGKVVLFTKRFGPSTKTAAGGVEVVLELVGKLRPADAQEMTVLEVRHGAGDTSLRAGQAVLSVDNPKAKWVYELRAGQRLRVETSFVRRVDQRCGGTISVADGWSDVVEAMGGNYFSARDGQVDIPPKSTYPQGRERHPRTNVGVTADGRVLLVTVDGRQPGYSIGVTLAEMGQLMVALDAKHAFNLDGGGSTVMAKRNLDTGAFQVVNRPSDGRERVHSQALAAFEVAP